MPLIPRRNRGEDRHAALAADITAIRHRIRHALDRVDSLEARLDGLDAGAAAQFRRLKALEDAVLARPAAAAPAPPAPLAPAPDGAVVKAARTRRTAAEKTGTAPAGKDGGTTT